MWRPPNVFSRKGLRVLFKFIWKLIKIIFVALIVFGIVSMILSLVIIFTLSSKMATEMAASQDLGYPPNCQTETLKTKNQENVFVTPGVFDAGSQFFPTPSLIL